MPSPSVYPDNEPEPAPFTGSRVGLVFNLVFAVLDFVAAARLSDQGAMLIGLSVEAVTSCMLAAACGVPLITRRPGGGRQ